MRKIPYLVLMLAVICLLAAGCASDHIQQDEPVQTAERVPVSKAEFPDINSLTLKDDSTLYTAYDPVQPVCFYITVVGGNAADGTDHTLSEVNSYLNLQGMENVEKIKSEIIFQIGDETGPLPGEIGYDAIASNATINVRGRTSTEFPQKSYRIDLFDTAGLWRGQRAIALNKHPADPTRLRNMLYFQLLQDVPGMVSLRTQYVHLYVKDKTDPTAPDAFVDYGLFTQVELPNGRYLRNHGLSKNGALYKANLCEMFRYEDALKLETDPEFDAAAFERVLEPKTTNDHEGLLKMLDAVNDLSQPIEKVIEQYFDMENLTSYLAFNMLMGNADSDAQNYYLYSPVNSDTWYFLCWDGDGCLSYYEDELTDNKWADASWTQGVSCYWGNHLFNRALRLPAFREALRSKVEALHQVITVERINELIALYRETADRYTTVMPDAVGMGMERGKLDLLYENMALDTNQAYQYILDSFERPMPFYLGDVTAEDGELMFSWDPSYDFQEEFVRYQFEIATDWFFEGDALVYSAADLLTTSQQTALLPPGLYYWRVIAVDESGNTQIAFDQVETDSGIHSGMLRMIIEEDGTVINAV